MSEYKFYFIKILNLLNYNFIIIYIYIYIYFLLYIIDTSYLDKELGSGCYYKNVEIIDKKVYTWTIPQWSMALDREKLFSKTFEVGGCKW